MGRRHRAISTSILRAIFHYKGHSSHNNHHQKNNEYRPPGLLARILALFSVFYISLERYRAELFKKLRNDIWEVDEEEYVESFRNPGKGSRTDLIAIGDLGYSGSVC
ncbi:uncharacterized protein EI97DRAFT_161686 [Westerdykella ornata]|uniref:Uncharacterized protein n=1 Tax=Westerdykella ornata TaxID=318751 RepID=A0A6A6J9T9_WESOR|nr:uncharacterized protein EI97DRAFT_161686 [Westerdykella ornata]KAF2273341.1 hypothetical protein EI97DRAFT_161686 [Westerdykella ornata]